MSFRHFALQTACCFALLLVLSAPIHLRAQGVGSLDTSFNPAVGGPAPYVYATVVQSDGKFVLGGRFSTINGVARNGIARLNADGSLDTSFAADAGTGSEIVTIALQTDGKILVGGGFTAVNGVARANIARINVDGTLDTVFRVDPDNDFSEISVQSDGKIVICGYFTSVNGVARNHIARLNADGSLDTGFDPGSGPDGFVYAQAVQSDGKILIGGHFFSVNGVAHNRIARLSANGSLDTGFNTAVNNDVTALALQSSGKIVVGGFFNSANGRGEVNYIAQLNPDGSLDTGFNAGSAAKAAVLTVAIQSNGKIFFGGRPFTENGVSRGQIGRLNADGSTDSSFIPNAGADETIFDLYLQSDGKIIASGFFSAVNGVTRIGVARLNGDPRGAFAFDAASYNAAESLGGVTLAVTRTGGSVGVVSVNYATANGSAQAGVDYVATTGTLSWADGDTTPKTITVPIVNDATAKSGESFAVVLSAPGGGAGLGAPVQSLVNILDDDVPTQPGVPAPVVTSSASAGAQVGASFSFAITATNTPTSFAAVGLPPGLDLNASTGLISGTPTTAGTFTVGVGATNAGGTGTASLILIITVPPANITAVNILSPPTNISVVAGETIDLQVAVEALNGTLATVEFDVTDAGGNRTYLGNSTAPRDHKTWNPPALGDFTLSATATDTTGKPTRSEIPIHVVAGGNPPVSQLLSGLDGKNFAAGSTLPLVALATDVAGQPLSNVQFYLDGVLVPGVTSAAVLHRQDASLSPYAKANAKLGNLIGDALLTMTGTDGRGVTSVSKAANVHLKAATAMFICALTGRDGSSTYAPGANVTATASAVETGGSVARVEYFLNDQSVGVATGADFALTFPLPGTVGQYALTAIATDTKGVSAASAPVILSAVETLLPPPVVTITGNASVKKGGNAKLVVRREGGDTNKAITVRYKLAGAVKAGTDYKPLTGMVILAAGTPTAKLKLKTIDNTSVDGTRVVKVKLLPSTDGTYTLGTPAATKLKITDND